MANPLISCVTGTWNRIALLQAMVKSVRDNTPPGILYEVIVVDGGSTDGTVEWCEAQSDIVLIKQTALVGAIRAFGAGFDIARGQFTLILNDDIELLPGAIMRCLVHLQDHPSCGIAAISDNRPQSHKHGEYDIDYMRAVKNGKPVSVPYGQICLVRTYLGKAAGWWGHKDPAFVTSRTYAGDNRLSGKVWELGYTVEKVEGAKAYDHIKYDGLRETNIECGAEDSMNFYNAFPGGTPRISPSPMIPQQDNPTVRMLYLPIYEPGWTVQKMQKHGLRDALARAHTPNGWDINVYELDYLAIPAKDLEAEILRAADIFQPRIILTQIQGHLPITPAILAKLRGLHPNARIINFNGDVAEGGLINPQMLILLRYIDLQLVVNASVLPVYEQIGIKADYWQLAAETVNEPLPLMANHDVVFLGSFNNPARLPLKDTLESLESEQINVGIYQPGDSSATLYDFAKGEALYRNAKIAVGSNEYPLSYGFVSNRLFQAMAAGGSLYLQQKIDGLQELTGITAGVHYIEWMDYEDLKVKIRYFLKPENEADRIKIANTGTRYIQSFHSFDNRVKELFALMKKHMQPYQTTDSNAMYLRYIGPMQEQFGIPSKISEHRKYVYEPGKLLLVDKLDCPYFLSQPELWELIAE